MSGPTAGVGVTDECIEAFQSLKIGHKHRYVIFKLSDNLEVIEVDKVGAEGSSYEDFVGDLPADDCRYAVYDFEYNEGEGQRNKILLVLWAPDTARIKSKMIYTSTKDTLKKRFVGIGSEIQATDMSEIDHETVLAKVTRI